MRQIKDLKDAEAALKDLNNRLETIENKDLNLKGRKITSLADGVKSDDAATVGQLPVITQDKVVIKHYRTILWNTTGEAETDADLPWYRFGRFLSSNPIELWMELVTPPSTDDLVINLTYRLNPDEDEFDLFEEADQLTIIAGEDTGVETAVFKTPFPNFGHRSRIRPKIISGGGASIVTIGLVVEQI